MSWCFTVLREEMNSIKCMNPRLINQTKSLFLKFNSPQKMVHRHCTVRRAILYTPGNDKRKIDAALSIKLDCIAFDLETSIEYQTKARTTIHDLLNEGCVAASDPEWCVKMNPIQTGSVFLADMEVVLSAKQLPAAILLPDVDSVDLLQWFTEQLWKKLMMRPEDDRGPIKLLITVGSARGIMLLREICDKIQDLATMAPIIPSAIILDNCGLIDSIGGTRTSHGIEILYARQKTVFIAKAFGLQAIDIPNTNPMALEELHKECREGAFMGFTGKQVLFPNHVAIVQKEFTPTRSKVARAKTMVKKMTQIGKSDMGDFTPERIPTDDPKLKVAKHTLDAAAVTSTGIVQDNYCTDEDGR